MIEDRASTGDQPSRGPLIPASAAPGLETLPLTVDVAIDSERLPESFPGDPADRLIAATARVHGLVVITADRLLRASDAVRTLW
jgi:PIN domain nuclease of toxin-antitoxin system